MARTFYRVWQDAFPDNQLETLRIVDGKDAVVLECSDFAAASEDAKFLLSAARQIAYLQVCNSSQRRRVGG